MTLRELDYQVEGLVPEGSEVTVTGGFARGTVGILGQYGIQDAFGIEWVYAIVSTEKFGNVTVPANYVEANEKYSV